MEKFNWGVLLICLLFTVLITGCEHKAADNEVAPDHEEEIKTQQDDPVFIAEGIRKLTIISTGEEFLNISYEPRDYESSYEYWKIYKPYGEEATVDTEALLGLYKKLASLKLEEAPEVTKDVVNELKDTQTQIRFEFVQTDDQNEASKVNADSMSTLLLVEKEDHYYAAYEGNLGKVYLVNKKIIDEIVHINPFDLILKISATANVDTVEKVEITIGEQRCELKIKDDEEVSMYTDLFSILIREEMDEERDGNADMLMQLKFIRNTDELSDLVLKYYDYNDSMATVSVNGEEHFLVNKKDVAVLKDRILEFMQ